MLWKVEEGTERTVARANDFPLAACVPWRCKLTNAANSPVFSRKLRDARRAIGAVDEGNAVHEEPFGNAVREVVLPSTIGGLPRIVPTAVDHMVEYPGVPPALNERGVGAR